MIMLFLILYGNIKEGDPRPQFQLTSIVFLMVCIMGALFGIITIFAKKMKRNLAKISWMTRHIQNNNLDFEVECSQIQEINDVIFSLEEMRDTLKGSLQTQWELEKNKQEHMGALAHDIKIPITIIKGNAELLRLSDHSPEQAIYIEYILNAGNKIEQYISLLIQLSRSDSDVLAEALSCISIQKFVKDLVGDTIAYCGKKTVQFVLKDNRLLDIKVYMYQDLLQRALMNVLCNAVDHTPAGGTVVWEISYLGNSIEFAIRDSGEGFSPEGLKRATQLFYMEDKSRSSKGHYGIGLTFAAKVINHHQGTMMLENHNEVAPYGGGVVRIIIPVKMNMVLKMEM
ncbi:sensor histidine kinase [Paenibacillus sp. NRS-1781]